jgi:poly(beta-D-mannuronate) lyase
MFPGAHLKTPFFPLLLVAIAALTGCRHSTPTPLPPAALAPGGLHSPWDAANIAPTNAPFDCGPIIPISPNLSITTSLGSPNSTMAESVKSAAYAESADALTDLMRRVIDAADFYRLSGSQPAAHCVATLLTAAAQDHAMAGAMVSLDAWQAQNRALRALAIAFLKVRDSNIITPQQSAIILAWMSDIVHQERVYYEHDHCYKKQCNLLSHRGLEVAMASAAIGIATNDRGMYNWGINQYRTAVEDISSHGMLHYDTRGRYALKFHIESAAALVQIAEFAQSNNEPLYDYNNGAIHLLIHTVTRGIVDPALFASTNHANQLIPSQLESWEISWASVYNGRFPDPVISSLLHQVGPGGADMWGGEPPDPLAAEQS